MIMQKMLAIIIAGISSTVAAGSSVSHGPAMNQTDCYDVGYQIKDQKIVSVSRERYFGEFLVTNKISDAREKVKVYNPKKGELEDKELYAFEGARIRKLVIDGKKCGKINSKCFSGIRGLEEIEFEESIPEFEEDHGWFAFGESDWREGLKKVVVNIEHMKDLGRVHFIGDVKCIEIQGVLPDVSITPDLSKCGSLSRLIVPYELAASTNISWGKALDRSVLQGTEVLSSSDNSGRVVLLKASRNGDISDVVTDMRTDALDACENPYVDLPISLRRMIVVGSVADFERNFSTRFRLKKDCVRFYPEIDRPAIRGLARMGEAFASTFPVPTVTVTTAYSNLILRLKFGNEDKIVENSQKCGSAYEVEFGLPREQKITLESYMRVEGLEDPILVSLHNAGQKLELELPAARGWKVTVCLGTIVTLLVIWIGAWIVRIFSLDKNATLHCIALAVTDPAFVESSRKGDVLDGVNDWRSCWRMHIGLVVGVLVFWLGCTGVMGDWLGYYIWRRVVSYLNTSFVSSLVISVTTTLIEMVVGLLQGISVKPFGAGVDLSEMLAPVQRMLGRITALSWLSTVVLAATRMLVDMLQKVQGMLLGFLGVMVVLWGAIGSETIRKVRWLAFFVSGAAVGALGFPLLLLACSSVSGAMAEIAGDGFAVALGEFRCVAEHFTLSSLLSLSAMQTLMADLSDATARLVSASVYYMAVKAFDCFLVPLSLVWGVLQVLRHFGYAKEVDIDTLARRFGYDKTRRVENENELAQLEGKSKQDCSQRMEDKEVAK